MDVGGKVWVAHCFVSCGMGSLGALGAVVPGESLALALGLVPTMTTPLCAALLPEGIVVEPSPSHTMKTKVSLG